MNLVKITITFLDEFNRRLIKFYRMGLSDVQTSFQAAPYGIDSNPIANMIAVYSETGEKGKTVIVGYLNKSQLALIGETRLFSTDENGLLKTYVWLTNTGLIKLGGEADNIVRFIPLDSKLTQQATDINVELVKIASVLNSLVPGSYTVEPIVLDISASKVDEVFTTGSTIDK